MAWIGPGGSVWFAIACFLLAVGPVAVYAVRERARIRQNRLATTEEQRRAELQESRRAREDQQKEARKVERASEAAAEQRLSEQRAEQRRQQVETEARTRNDAIERDREAGALQQELSVLDDAAYTRHALDWLEARGYRIEPVPADPESSFLLRDEAGALQSIAHAFERDAAVGAGDVMAIEDIRQKLEVGRAYLFARDFTPEAVEAVKDLQVQLVDGHMLAVWLVSQRWAASSEATDA
jgi:hypothetical protein